ncbi:MAG TPA: FAD-binding oxidoreductase [Candidatus Eremiobacteraceae bacterium]|nr:FAD-binding oxidoreductase [Candidatus Eremiobacteraceae bacterium]
MDLIASMQPSKDARPATIAEVAQILADAVASGLTVTAIGGGTHLALGRSTRGPNIVLHTTELRNVVEHTPDDMTISVEAGMRIADFRDLLARHRSRLPIDVETPDRATIGGMIAFGAAGPRRLGLGTLRDYLIGARFAQPDGHVVKTGGMVVKNVSGYDLTRMLHGSVGALGVIGSLNFKLAPVPAAQTVTEFALAHSGEALAAASAIVDTRLPFAAVHARSDSTVVVGCEGHTADAKRLRAEARAIAMRHGATERESVEGESDVNAEWRDFMAAPFGDRTATFRIVSTQSRVAADIERAAAIAQSMRFGPVWSVDAGCGTAELSVECADRSDEIVKLERELTEMVTLRVTRCPLATRSRLILHGRPPAGARLMRLLRSQFDPTGVLSGAPFADGPNTDG